MGHLGKQVLLGGGLWNVAQRRVVDTVRMEGWGKGGVEGWRGGGYRGGGGHGSPGYAGQVYFSCQGALRVRDACVRVRLSVFVSMSLNVWFEKVVDGLAGSGVVGGLHSDPPQSEAILEPHRGSVILGELLRGRLCGQAALWKDSVILFRNC